MLKSTHKKMVFFFIVSVLIFSATFVINPKLSNSRIGNFDWWSESLLYSDLLYYGDSSVNETPLFCKGLDPGVLAKIYGGDWPDYENHVRLAYQTEDCHYKKSDFGDYTSNIVIQRFLFRYLDSVLPISNALKIHLFKFIICLLLAFSISVVLCWIVKELNNFKIGMEILLLLSLFAPYLLMCGKNLYWCVWSLFLPIVIMILLIESKWFQKSEHKLFLLSISALFGILIKCLFYFEFVSVVMVSMMIPVIYYLLELDDEEYTLKKKMTYFTIVSVSAIVGFLIVVAIKFILLKSYYGNNQEALGTLFGNIQDRLIGNISSDNISTAESANASILTVFTLVFMSPFIGIKYVFSITHFGIVFLLTVSTIILFSMDKKWKLLSKRDKNWIVCCWISILAPISWFVLARPHTYLHYQQSSITWFIIFDFMALSVIELLACKISKIIRKEL